MNNRLSLILSISSLLLVTGLMIYQTRQPKQETRTENTAPAGNTAGKIVFVNIDTLMDKYDFYQDSKKKIEAQIKTLQKEVESRAMSIESELKGYQQKSDKMSPVEMESAQKSLAGKQQNLQAYRSKMEEEIAKEQSSLDKLLKGKINDYLRKICEENGYDFILTYNATGIGMLYGKPALDITAKVVTELNDLYRAEKK